MSTLIIFIKNPEKGKVKTRLAKTIGDDNALTIYRKLLEHTRNITQDLAVEKHLYYSWYISPNDQWDNHIYQKQLQIQGDLGAKMASAFQASFDKGATKVVIIGSDCYALQSHHLATAFDALDKYDVVLGPAKDGGYYLLGMTHFVPNVFENKAWSTETVLKETLHDLQNLQKTHSLLPQLSDIDHARDLPPDFHHLIQN